MELTSYKKFDPLARLITRALDRTDAEQSEQSRWHNVEGEDEVGRE